MKVLGVNYGHNATLALMDGGKLVFCQSEERFNRIKNSTGFPSRTLAYIHENIAGPDEIDLAVLYQKTVYGYLYFKTAGFEPHQHAGYINPDEVKLTFNQRLLTTDFGWNLRKLKIAFNEKKKSLNDEAAAHFSRCLKMPPEKIASLDHHMSHAYSAVPNINGWGPTLVFTLDGVGDWNSATVNAFDGESMKTLSVTEHRNSLGYIYTGVTAWMGMKPGEHEFKVMGLAPYAKRRYYEPILKKLEKLIWINERGEMEASVTPVSLLDEFTRMFLYQRFDNIAGALQEHTENLVLDWVRYWVEKTGIRNVALSGGVFMNVKACQRLAESGFIEKLFVVPSAGDESSAIGCCVWGTMDRAKDVPIAPLKDLYLGVEYGDGEIEKTIRETGAADRYNITRPENVNRAVAQLLADDNIVSRCSGPMEFGARALGNRSILANPRRFENVQHINDAIKSRDFWMPFTPSILEEDMPRYVANHERIFAPYMCITFQSTKEARRDLTAAIHPKDHTLRPQCVVRDWNPAYHEIISAFKELTGVGGVLNTSFNLHGEPNVCSPADAIRTVDNSGLNYLAMGGFLLEKKEEYRES